jgi:hypothetical protein
MPYPRHFVQNNLPIGQRRCPGCGQPMVLAFIEATDIFKRDERAFECAECAYEETVIAEFR